MRTVGLAALILVHAVAGANEVHRKVSELPEDQRRAVFAKMMQREGEPCRDVSRTYFQGRSSDGGAFWSFTCVGGTDWQVMFGGPTGANIKLLECAVVKRLGSQPCFRQFK